MKKLYLILLLAWITMSATAQNVTQIEYFIDTDAGVGNNTIVSLTPAADGSFNFTASLTGVSIGYHKLYMRTRDSDGKWSLTSRRNIEVTSIQTTRNMVAAEYFYDTDPGAGNATRVTLTTGTDVTQNFVTNTASLTPGYHKLYIRTLDTDGNWSITSRRNVEAPFPEANIINAAEYFFDTDPGVGNGIPIAVSPQTTDITQSFTANTAALAPGFHKLYLRIQDQQGKWSLTSRRNAEIYNPDATARVIGVEYAFGVDPGAGNAPYIAFATPAADGSFTFNIPPSQVPNQKDSLYLRAKDSTNKNWSITQRVSKTFSSVGCSLPDIPSVIVNDNKCSGNAVTYKDSTVTGATGYIWTVPTGWTVVSGQGTTAISLTAPVVTTATTYTLSFAAINGCGTGNARTFTVTVNPLPVTPMVTAGGPVSFCAGGSVLLTSSSTTGNQWFKDGAVITGATNATYTATTAGTYTVRVTNAGGCTVESTATIVALNAAPATPVITAGGPVSFCAGGSVVLTSSATTGNQWLKDGNLLAGITAAVFPVNAAGSYTVRVTNAGGCTATSTATVVVVNTAPPIAVISQNGNVLSSSATTGNQWYKEGVVIAGATAQNYTVTQSGNYTVQVTVNGCASPVSDKLNVTVTAIFDPVLVSAVKIYPNPVASVINIVNSGVNRIAVVLYDMTGKKIAAQERITGTYVLPAGNLVQGCYLLNVTDERTKKSFYKLLVKE